MKLGFSLIFIHMLFLKTLQQRYDEFVDVYTAKRDLTVYSTSASASFYEYQNVQLNIQAVDDFGVNITTGGDKYVIEIKNECKIAGNNTCVPVSGLITVLNPEIKSYMTDNLNGTYSFNFMLTKYGKVTILVYFEPPSPVLFQLWNNPDLVGNYIECYWYPNINKTWVSGYLTST